MSKMLITVAAIAVVLALVAFGAVVISQNSSSKPAVETPAPVAKVEPTAVPKEARKPRVKMAAQPKEAEVVAEPAKVEAVASAAPKGEVDLESFVKGLTPEQEQKLQQMLSQRMMEKMRKQQRYQLPADVKLQMLTYRNNGELKLSEVQQQQVSTIKDGFKARLDAQLANNWTRSDELYSTMSAKQQIQQSTTATDAEKAAARQELNQLYKEMGELNQQAQQAKQGMDDEYLSAVRAVLSQQQAQVIDEMKSWGAGGTGGNVFNVRPMGGQGGMSGGKAPGG